MSVPPPNYTQIPNALFDLMADKEAGLTEAELRVLLAVARKTFGWHKKRDKISLSQLVTMTSLVRSSVVAGIEAALTRGILRRTPDKNDKRGGYFYELAVDDIEEISTTTSPKSELVQNSNQSSTWTRTSPNFEPELVQNSNTQKKDKEKKESVRVEPDEFTRALADLCAVNLQLLKRTPKERAAFKNAYTGLREIGATVEQVSAFSAYWYSDSNWITRKARRDGVKPEAPKPEQVLAEWNKALAQAPKAKPAALVTTATTQPARKQLTGAEVREKIRQIEASK